MNHYLTAKFAAEMFFPEELIDAAVSSILPDRDFGKISEGLYQWSGTAEDDCETVSVNLLLENSLILERLKKALLNQKKVFESSFQAQTLHEQQKASWAVRQRGVRES